MNANQGAFTKTPELRTELRLGKNQLKKLVLLRPLRKYGFCSLGILEVFICETPLERILDVRYLSLLRLGKRGTRSMP